MDDGRESGGQTVENFPAMRFRPTDPLVVQAGALDPHLSRLRCAVLFEEEGAWFGVARECRIVAPGEPLLLIVDVGGRFNQGRVGFETLLHPFFLEFSDGVAIEILLEVAEDGEERVDVLVSVAWWQKVHPNFVIPPHLDKERQECKSAPVLVFPKAVVCLK